MTSRELSIALSAADCSPRVEGEELVFDREPPTDVLPYVALLQTGVRAILTGRHWFGIDATGRGCGPLVDGAMSADETLPTNCVLLTVAGDRLGWDRIDPAARGRTPDAFHEPPAKVKKSREWVKR